MKRSKREGPLGHNRTGLNVFTVLVTCGFLFCVTQISNGELTSTIVQVARNLNKELLDALEIMQDVNYTNIETHGNYSSSTRFNPKGMAVLYNVTNMFIEKVLPDIIPFDFLQIDASGKPIIKEDDLGKVLLHYLAILLLVVCLVMFAMFMPLCGLCFCCCRCCGNCGAKKKSYDKKNDLCKKIIFATLLIILGTLFLFGVVCAFVSNQQMQDGTDELTTNLKTGLKDTNTFYTSTKNQIGVLLNTNFGEFFKALDKTLHKASEILFEQLAEISQAASMKDAKEMVDTLHTVKSNLEKIKQDTNDLRVDASQLSDAMRKLKRDLLEALRECHSNPKCQELLNNYVNKLGTTIDFDSIPDMTEFIQNIDAKLSKDFISSIENGVDKLNNIQKEINDKLKVKLNELSGKVQETGDEINLKSKDVVGALDSSMERVNKTSHDALDIADKYINQYSIYRYYVGLGVSCVLLLITLCVAFGLICGICGKKASDIDDDCCNKGAGSKFLIFGVAIMFLTALVLVAVLLVHLIAIVPHMLVCDPLRNPRDSKVLHFVDELLEKKKDPDFQFNLSEMIQNCYSNKSAYVVFNLKQKFDLEEIREIFEKFEIDKLLDQLQNDLNIGGDIQFLEETDLNRLRMLGDEMEIKFDKVINELNVTFTTVDLLKFQTELRNVIDSLTQVKYDVTSLNIIAMHIDTYIEKLFLPMKERAQNVIILANDTNNMMIFGKSSFKEAINEIVDNITHAQDYLAKNGTEEIKLLTKTFANAILQQAKNYTTRIVTHFENDVGDCGPVALVINGTLTSTCDKILAPMNGFWFSIFWCILLFIPTIITSVKLASVYQKRDQYTQCESDYYYDDRENIPLAQVKYGKKKQKKKRTDGRNYMPERDHHNPHDYSGTSHHDAARYEDIAPKHFADFPNGGPPQYQRAPTEYERPPPYYYPGSGDH